jgi:Polyketide cyclase / dehydrase and lipid transport
MAAHGRSRQTAASPQAIWRLWSDPATWHEWNPSVQRMSMNGPFANGTTGQMFTPAGRTHDIQLDDVQAGKSFDLKTAVLPGTRFTFHCEVTPANTGSTISQSLSMSGPLAFVFSPLAGDRIASTFEGVLEGLAKRAEGS